jgi:hypothetical protein
VAVQDQERYQLHATQIHSAQEVRCVTVASAGSVPTIGHVWRPKSALQLQLEKLPKLLMRLRSFAFLGKSSAHRLQIPRRVLERLVKATLSVLAVSAAWFANKEPAVLVPAARIAVRTIPVSQRQPQFLAFRQAFRSASITLLFQLTTLVSARISSADDCLMAWNGEWVEQGGTFARSMVYQMF